MYSEQLVDDDFVLLTNNESPTGTKPAQCSPSMTSDNPTATSEYLDFIANYIDRMSPVLRPVNLAIHDNPELNFHEFHAHKVLTDFMNDQKGWKVTPHAYGIKTAFVAVFDSGRKGPVVSFNAEYDALPGIGHACGHNLIAMASLSGALAAKAVIEKEELGGKVVLFGTPAEEGGGGKIKLLEAGAYADHKVDINLISHGGITSDSALTRTSAYTDFRVEYFGREAHAAAAPWEGLNALDGLITAYNAISVLRQQTQPGDIIQGNITHGGVKPNIIHAYAAAQFVVRSSNRARREKLKARVLQCFRAGETASGTRLVVTQGGSYDDHMPNLALGARYRGHFNALGGSIEAPELDWEHSSSAASSDQGNVSYAMPSISPGFWIRSEGKDGKPAGGPHTPGFAGAARTKEAHAKAMMVGKALAGVAVDVLTIEGLLGQVKKEFEAMKKKNSA